jgi:hypothetical protein
MASIMYAHINVVLFAFGHSGPYEYSHRMPKWDYRAARRSVLSCLLSSLCTR